jgi:hypothetical protein
MKLLSCAASAATLLAVAATSQAAVSYSVPGSVYTQDFDSLPNTPVNTSLGASPAGWKDNDPTATGTNFSIPGWYLRHATSVAEGGFNGRQRLRIGTGSATTGAFMSFGAAGDTDRALGSVGANTLAGDGDSMRMALRLRNDTGATLTEFTVIYDGEQWRAGANAASDIITFSWMMQGTDETNWHSAGESNPATFVPQLAFTPRQTSTTGAAVDGNDTGPDGGATRNITFTVTGINWAPETDLWLRWSDVQVSGVDDGLAIDNVRFTAAVPEPTSLALLGLGGLTLLTRRRRH